MQSKVCVAVVGVTAVVELVDAEKVVVVVTVVGSMY